MVKIEMSPLSKKQAVEEGRLVPILIIPDLYSKSKTQICFMLTEEVFDCYSKART